MKDVPPSIVVTFPEKKIREPVRVVLRMKLRFKKKMIWKNMMTLNRKGGNIHFCLTYIVHSLEVKREIYLQIVEGAALGLLQARKFGHLPFLVSWWDRDEKPSGIYFHYTFFYIDMLRSSLKRILLL